MKMSRQMMYKPHMTEKRKQLYLSASIDRAYGSNMKQKYFVIIGKRTRNYSTMCFMNS